MTPADTRAKRTPNIIRAAWVELELELSLAGAMTSVVVTVDRVMVGSGDFRVSAQDTAGELDGIVCYRVIVLGSRYSLNYGTCLVGVVPLEMDRYMVGGLV